MANGKGNKQRRGQKRTKKINKNITCVVEGRDFYVNKQKTAQRQMRAFGGREKGK